VSINAILSALRRRDRGHDPIDVPYADRDQLDANYGAGRQRVQALAATELDVVSAAIGRHNQWVMPLVQLIRQPPFEYAAFDGPGVGRGRLIDGLEVCLGVLPDHQRRLDPHGRENHCVRDGNAS
jgi:hypothetical protein